MKLASKFLFKFYSASFLQNLGFCLRLQYVSRFYRVNIIFYALMRRLRITFSPADHITILHKGVGLLINDNAADSNLLRSRFSLFVRSRIGHTHNLVIDWISFLSKQNVASFGEGDWPQSGYKLIFMILIPSNTNRSFYFGQIPVHSISDIKFIFLLRTAESPIRISHAHNRNYHFSSSALIDHHSIRFF